MIKYSGYFLSFTFFSTLVFAQTEFDEAKIDTVESETIIVTASRFAQTADKTLASVTVITREDIERMQAQTLFDILQTQVGIVMNRTGGLGGNTSLFLRGSNSNHTLVMIDGIRVASSTTGSFTWQNLDPAQIDRIEIVRGARGSLYGSDAIGGVIQIFTRTSADSSAEVEVGSYDTYRVIANYGSRTSTSFNFNFSSAKSTGFSATKPENIYYYNPDNDGFHNNTVSFSAKKPIGSYAQLNFTGWRTEAYTEYDSGHQDSITHALGLNWSGAFTSDWVYDFNMAYNSDDSKNISDFNDFSSSIQSDRIELDWKSTLSIKEHTLVTGGIEVRSDRGKNSDDLLNTLVFEKKTNNSAGYINWHAYLALVDFQLGGRIDYQDSVGFVPTGQLAFSKKLFGVRIVTSIGNAFKSPTLNQLFHPGYPQTTSEGITELWSAGNPDLKPEKSLSSELSIRFESKNDRHRFQANTYVTQFDNLIDYQGDKNQAVNVLNVESPGIEFEYSYKQRSWIFASQITLQRTREAITNRRLLRRPDNKASIGVSKTIGRRNLLNLEWLWIGDRLDYTVDFTGTTTLPAYNLVNINAFYELRKDIGIAIKFHNVFDKDYELASGYNTQGRSIFLSLKYSLNR